jgi:DNA segregation ATPase FtsK/SpoIIIE-like protein
MISEETVFILGAGASNPYGYPTGKELRSLICKDFPRRYERFIKGDSENSTTWDFLSPEASDFAQRFSKSTTPSIDLFLARNTHFSDIGKIAIALCIWDAEHKSIFREKVNSDLDWYTLLFERMTKTLKTPDSYSRFRENEVTFITFNYDRSLEHFLHDSFVNSFGSMSSSKDPIKEQIPFDFFHVYGVISELPWQSNKGMKYGKLPELRSELSKMAKNIRPIYESSDPNSHDFKKKIRSAKRIYFLGFGYAEENLDILGIPAVLNPTQKIYGTALHWTKKEIDDLQKDFRPKSKTKRPVSMNLVFKDVNCYKLLREYL